MSDSKIRAAQDPLSTERILPTRPEERFALLQAQTRRHFLRSFTAGVGTMFLGTLASQFSLPTANATERGVDGNLQP